MGEVLGFQGDINMKRVNYSFRLIKCMVYLIFMTNARRTNVGKNCLLFENPTIMLGFRKTIYLFYWDVNTTEY